MMLLLPAINYPRRYSVREKRTRNVTRLPSEDESERIANDGSIARYPAIKFIDDRRKEATCFRGASGEGGRGKEEREQIDAESNSDSNGTSRADLPRGLKNI